MTTTFDKFLKARQEMEQFEELGATEEEAIAITKLTTEQKVKKLIEWIDKNVPQGTHIDIPERLVPPSYATQKIREFAQNLRQNYTEYYDPEAGRFVNDPIFDREYLSNSNIPPRRDVQYWDPSGQIKEIVCMDRIPYEAQDKEIEYDTKEAVARQIAHRMIAEDIIRFTVHRDYSSMDKIIQGDCKVIRRDRNDPTR